MKINNLLENDAHWYIVTLKKMWFHMKINNQFLHQNVWKVNYDQ